MDRVGDIDYGLRISYIKDMDYRVLRRDGLNARHTAPVLAVYTEIQRARAGLQGNCEIVRCHHLQFHTCCV